MKVEIEMDQMHTHEVSLPSVDVHLKGAVRRECHLSTPVVHKFVRYATIV